MFVKWMLLLKIPGKGLKIYLRKSVVVQTFF